MRFEIMMEGTWQTTADANLAASISGGVQKGNTHNGFSFYAFADGGDLFSWRLAVL